MSENKCQNCGHKTDELEDFKGESWCALCISHWNDPTVWGESETKLFEREATIFNGGL